MSLLNNVFLWAEGQMEGENLQKETFSLYYVLDELKDELNDRLEDKEITIDFTSAHNFELYSNRGLVRILLRNLIVNAIKFSHNQSRIEINCVRGQKTKVVEVIDNGIGMSEEMREGIFKGELISTAGTAGERGNGLGLSLCNDFVKSLGGKIEVESVLGEGSVFRIILKDKPAVQ